jgi:PAS domain S-box-containing protein
MASINNKTLNSLKEQKKNPVVIANREGVITYINEAFTKNYLWETNLIGSNIRSIIPDQFKDSHHIGFSRFNVTGISRVAGHPIDAMVQCGDGQQVLSRHFLVVEKVEGSWCFGAELKPLETANPHFVKVPFDQGKSNFELDQVRAVLGKMNLAIENISDSIIWSETGGKIFWSNRAFEQLVSQSIYDLIGKNFLEVLELSVGGHAVSSNEHPIFLALENGNSKSEYEINIATESKNVIVESATFEIENGDVYVVSTIKDITDQKQLERFLKADNLRMHEELNVAKGIQMSMIPPSHPDDNGQFSNIDIYGILQPAREVGGDFYNYYFINEHNLCFLVGDVSGKGVPAALLMAVTQALLKSKSSGNLSTADIVSHVNNEISKDNTSYMFITLFVAIYNIRESKMTYTNAGHNPSYIVKSRGKLEKLHELHGPVVGAMEGLEYKEQVVDVTPGDLILTYTDGVTEANNLEKEMYSDNRLTEFLTHQEFEDAHSLARNLVEDVKKHENGAEQFDDITILAVKTI